MHRERRGDRLLAALTPGGVTLSYRGRDSVVRTTCLAFEPDNAKLRVGSARTVPLRRFCAGDPFA